MNRSKVLSLYRQLLRISMTWKASTGNKQDTFAERNYIRDETRTLFRKNKGVTGEEIRLCTQEAETRLEMALHYGTPFPRPVNIPHQGLPLSVSKGKKAQDRLRRISKPVYLHSHDET
ncbi:LYR motif-containing protein 1-like [Anneissia japonica]|uniref:LYR motif-containing protein 1-like n=1 Tax=Anneissia japonica TaxID=1529436 RepID=UPI001425AFB7|nr:LYR motif-containing protein 1-like [Anneissia japonica]